MATAGYHRFDATRASGAMLVEHCDIPVGMTIGEWRAAAAAERRAARDKQRSARKTLRRVLLRR